MADAGGTQAERPFFHPDGSTERVRHESRLVGDVEYSESFNWLDGSWQPRRSYVWRRIG